MPIVFEATFTQPLLIQLDTGRIPDGKRFAKAITDSYVRTLLTGLPGGGTVPPVLPAPGLNPIAPPPFPIPSIPINNFVGRKRAMERILSIYFQAREFAPVAADIKETINSIKVLLKKGLNLKKVINNTVRTIRFLEAELRNLPNLLADIKNAVVQLIKNEKDRLTLLVSGLDSFKVTLTPAQFNQVFARQLELINAVASFNVTFDASFFGRVASLLQDIESELQAIPTFSEQTPEESIKKYINRQVKNILSNVIAIANSVVSPRKYVDYYESLAAADQTYQPLLDAVNRYVFLVNILEPQIIKLREKQRELVLRLQTQVTEKLVEIKKALTEKQKKLAAKKGGKGKFSIYVKAARTINSTKKLYLTKIRKLQKLLRDVQAVTRAVKTVLLKITAFNAELQQLYESEVGRLETLKQLRTIPITETLQIETGVDDIRRDVKQYLDEVGIKNASIQNILLAQITVNIPNINGFVSFFEEKSDRVLNVFINATTIERELQFIQSKVVEILTGNKQSKTQQRVALNNEYSLLDVVVYFAQTVQQQLQKLQQKIKDLAAKIRNLVDETLSRLINDVKDMIILLLPIKSDIKDPKNKAAILKAKKDKIQQTKNLIKKRIKQLRIVTNGVRSFTTITRNISSGNLRYSVNGVHINKLIDALYDYKLTTNAPNTAAIARDRATSKQAAVNILFGIELLVDLVGELIAFIASSDVLDRLKQYIQAPADNIVVEPYKQLYTLLTGLASVDKTPAGILRYIQSIDFTLFESNRMQSLLFDLEEVYASDLRAKYEQISENPFIKNYIKIKPYSESMLAAAFNYIKLKVIELKAFIDDKIYKKFIKPAIDLVRDSIAKISEAIKSELATLIKRAINIDAKLMTLAFNLATRAFWTGFRWLTPNGVQYVCINIGPFAPIIGKADDGASALVRQIARSLNVQLTLMTGLVIPPIVTAIPPFPYIGYR